MISILIPLYNYNVFPLVEVLFNQAEQLSTPYEIIIFDDASTITFEENRKITKFKNTSYEVSKKNIGRTAARDYLGNKAAYDWLLFLDADVMPCSNNFIREYIEIINNEHYELVFGGISYKPQKPSEEKMLRWKYGKNRETIAVSKRQKSPYLTINSGCFLISKKLFTKVNSQMTSNLYGLDLFFKKLLKQQKANVIHIKNPVFHLGLESSEQFIKKSEKALETIKYLEKNKKIDVNEYPLQKLASFLKRFHLTFLVVKFYHTFEKTILKNLTSKNPNLRLFDLYRLVYYSKLKNE